MTKVVAASGETIAKAQTQRRLPVQGAAFAGTGRWPIRAPVVAGFS